MSVAHALLGALARGERYGYELRRQVEGELGPEWRLDFGQLYRALGALHRRRWVSCRLEPGRGGPARKVYRLTRAGRAELRRWLRQQRPRVARRRDGAAVRVRFAAAARRGAGADEVLLAVGSDDLVLDLLAARLAASRPGVRFAAEPVGSLAGLIALHERRAHLAGIHLLDADSGEYNVAHVKHLLPEEPVVLVSLARREQGLMLAAGNPLGIRSLRHLARRGVRLVNRQAGAGTRLLLRHRLLQARIDPQSIAGYEREAATHAAVAAAIAGGAADAGPGVRAVAEAWGLEFLPFGEERYDLAIPRRVFESPVLRPLLEALHDPDLRRAAARLPGYDIGCMSRVVATIR
jgi:putative molybdopterin biosynthesis protein